MRQSLAFTAVLLLLAAVVPALGANPFADTKSKQEAVAAFADVEKSLVKKVGTFMARPGPTTLFSDRSGLTVIDQVKILRRSTGFVYRLPHLLQLHLPNPCRRTPTG